MSRVSSRVMVRVAAEVLFLTMRWPAEVFFLVFLPLMASLAALPTMVPSVAVTAVSMAFSTFCSMPCFFLPPFSVLAGLASSVSAGRL